MAQIKGAWVQARNWEMMAFGLVERGQKWGHSFYNHSYRSRTGILAPNHKPNCFWSISGREDGGKA